MPGPVGEKILHRFTPSIHYSWPIPCTTTLSNYSMRTAPYSRCLNRNCFYDMHVIIHVSGSSLSTNTIPYHHHAELFISINLSSNALPHAFCSILGRWFLFYPTKTKHSDAHNPSLCHLNLYLEFENSSGANKINI